MNDKAFTDQLCGEPALKQKAIDEFVKASRSGRMVAFVGSYTSLEFGYLKWQEFLEKATADKPRRVAKWTEVAKERFANIDQHTIIDYELLIEAGFGRDMTAEKIAEMFSLEKYAKSAKAVRSIKRPKFSKSSAITEICDGLGIDRIITLNYDLEFEHHLMTDPSISNPDKLKTAYTELKNLKEAVANSQFSQRMRKVTSDGKRIISDCFQRERADQLFSFAIHAPDTNAHIMHLHGRADAPETMVVSYSDYERQYRKSGITKLPFQHALKLLFAGNPIVFIGVGMSEEEILGTLRQFVSDDRPNYLAPDFIIWSPKDETGRKAGRKADSVSPEDELKRLRWYRQFGVLTLFDTELEGFDQTEDAAAEGGLRRSVKLLAENARTELKPKVWEKNEFRQMDAFINDGIDKGGANVWPVVSKAKTFEPLWLYKSGYYSETVASDLPKDIPNNEYLHWLIDYGSPIKAFLDSPGSGHGYLAQIIKSRVEDMRSAGEDIIYCQLNAGFAWEIDSTFALVSGLYDEKTAFEENMSRTKGLEKFTHDLMALAANDEGPKRRIVITINGADRFFDTSGYPLSSELDILIRLVPRLNKFYQSQRNEARRRLHNQKADQANEISKSDWHTQEFPLPVTLIVFGTNRVGRYFDGLGLTKGDIKTRTAGDYDILGSMPEPFASSEPLGKSLVDRIRLEQKADTNGASFPLLKDPAKDQFKSVYLRLTEAALREARAAKKPKAPQLKLGIAAETALDRCRHGDTGRQRRAFFDIFLSPAVLQQVFDETSVGSSTLKSSRRKTALALAIMRKMALIGQPVEAKTLAAINPIKFEYKLDADNVLKFLEELQLLNLVSEIHSFPGVATRRTNRRFALHRALLQEIRERGSVPLSDARTYTSFNIPLYVAQPIDDHEPDDDVYEELGELLDELIGFDEESENDVEWASFERGNRLRAAFASTRSYYTASSMLMHEPDPKGDDKASRLGEYAQRLDRLIAASERAAEARKRLIADGNFDATANPSHVFPDDLVWLHDHRATTLLAQGDLYEARHALKSAESFNEKFVEFESHDQNFRRLQINQIHVDIERGKIDSAENRLRRLEQSINHQAEQLPWHFKNSKRVGKDRFVSAVSEILEEFGSEPRRRARIVNSDFPADLILSTGVMTGYRAWCEYIRGRLRTSDRYFEQAIQILRNIGEQRAYAIFLRLHVALLDALGDRERATISINLCIAAADSTRQLDISHMAWTTKAGLDLRYDPHVDRAEIMKQLMATLRYSSQTDMYRVRMEALGTLARLRFEAGDYDGALEKASDAMAIAIRFGFALRKISLRILIGTCLIRRGDPISGNAILDEAVRIADLLGYQRAIELAHRARTDQASMFI